jgi:xanthine dehydrogenase accessory factor
VIAASGRVLAGWVGGGCAESTVCHAALECLRGGSGRIVDLDLNDEVLGTGMPCGGSMRVFVEGISPQPALWILGHGRVAECLCQFGATLGLHVLVLDDMAEVDRYKDAAQLITDDIGYQALQPKVGDYVVVATQHKGDHQSMRRALSLEVDYIALIASHKRSRLVMDYLREEGFSDAALARVYAPCGLDLGCRTPEEVALSVLGEIVMLRRGGSGRSMREKLTLAAGMAA